MALGPESINRLDLESGDIEEIAADARYDFLQPRDDKQGNVYCIRRPLSPGRAPRIRCNRSATSCFFPFHFLEL